MTSFITADLLMSIIKDTLLRMNLKIEHCWGQNCDGASAMSSAKNGVAKQISTDEPQAVYTHFYGHAFNLSMGDCIKQCEVMKLVIVVMGEISNLVNKSSVVMCCVLTI